MKIVEAVKNIAGVIREKGVVGAIGEEVEGAVSATTVGFRARFDRRYREAFVNDLEDGARATGRVNRWDHVTVFMFGMNDFESAYRRLDAARLDYKQERN